MNATTTTTAHITRKQYSQARKLARRHGDKRIVAPGIDILTRPPVYPPVSVKQRLAVKRKNSDAYRLVRKLTLGF